MEDGKIEDLFLLALDTPEELREKSPNLSAGYDAGENRWEIILRYSGDVQELADTYGTVTELLGGYIIMTVTGEELSELSENPRVEYIEKPKVLFFELYDAKSVSCISPVQRPPFNLTGKGVLVGVIDSGERVILLSSWQGSGQIAVFPHGYKLSLRKVKKTPQKKIFVLY